MKYLIMKDDRWAAGRGETVVVLAQDEERGPKTPIGIMYLPMEQKEARNWDVKVGLLENAFELSEEILPSKAAAKRAIISAWEKR